MIKLPRFLKRSWLTYRLHDVESRIDASINTHTALCARLEEEGELRHRLMSERDAFRRELRGLELKAITEPVAGARL